MMPLLPEQFGLLQGIIENPKDDAPRLIYADWLEDHGQDAYAAYIRDRVRNPALATDYVQECTAALHWCEPDDPIRLVESKWRRGFPYFVRCPMDVWMEIAGELMRRWPIQGLAVSDKGPWGRGNEVESLYGWHRGLSYSQQSVPDEVFFFLGNGDGFPYVFNSWHDAVAALYEACLAFGRSEAARLNRLEGLTT